MSNFFFDTDSLETADEEGILSKPERDPSSGKAIESVCVEDLECSESGRDRHVFGTHESSAGYCRITANDEPAQAGLRSFFFDPLDGNDLDETRLDSLSPADLSPGSAASEGARVAFPPVSSDERSAAESPRLFGFIALDTLVEEAVSVENNTMPLQENSTRLRDFSERPSVETSSKRPAPSGSTTWPRPPQLTAHPSLIKADPGAFDGAEAVDQAIEVLSRASAVSIHVQATSLTPWSLHKPVSKSLLIAETVRLGAYLKTYGSEEVDARQRLRILSLRAEGCSNQERTEFFFDMDRLDEAQRMSLVHALHAKIWMGSNLAYDLQWLQTADPGVEPAFLIDTLLSANCFRPGLIYELHNQLDGVEGNPALPLPAWSQDRLRRLSLLLRRLEKRTSGKLRRDADQAMGFDTQTLSQALLDIDLDDRYKKPYNWTVPVLSAGHYAACQQELRVNSQILCAILGLETGSSVEALLQAMRNASGYPAYDIAQRVMPRLSRMQRNGIRVSPDRVGALISDFNRQIESDVAAIVRDAPELFEFKDELRRPGQGTYLFQQTLAAALERLSGIPVPRQTIQDLPALDEATLNRLYPEIALCARLKSLHTATREVSLAQDFLVRAQLDKDRGRIHPMTTIFATSLRTASREPSAQGTPSGKSEFKRIFEAEPGYSILSIDLSSVEMRGAAVLSARAWRSLRRLWTLAKRVRAAQQSPGTSCFREMSDYVRYLDESIRLRWIFGSPGDRDIGGMPYLIDWILDGAPPLAGPDQASDPQGRLDIELLANRFPTQDSGVEGWRLHYSAILFRILERMRAAGAFQERPEDDVLTLLSAFREGIDPHLLTAIKNLRRQGGIYIPSNLSPLDYLRSLSPEARRSLRDRQKEARTAAKPENFGLLYGMSDAGLHAYGINEYGINWSLDEASESKETWLALYPEIDFLQWMTRLRSTKNALVSFTSTSRSIKSQPGNLPAGKIWIGTTLTGRPVVAPNSGTLLNRSNQGSCAELAFSIINAFSQDALDRFINFVHDEFVFEVEKARENALAQEILQVILEQSKRFFYDVFGHPQSMPWGCPMESEFVIDTTWSHS